MKNILIIVLICISMHIKAQKVQLDLFNVRISLPAGWTISEEEGGYGCYSADRQNIIFVMEDPENSMQYYNQALLSGVDIGGGTTIQTTGALIPVSVSTAYAPIWILTSNGNAKGWGGLKQKKTGGVIGFIAIASEQNLPAIKSRLLTMLGSCEEILVSDNTSHVQQWIAALTSNQLEGGFESYSSGYGDGGGTASSSTYDFCNGGRYSYTYEYSSSISGTSVKTEHGNWRLFQESGGIVLVLRSYNGESRRYKLTQKGGVIYLNKTGFQRTRYRPTCQ